MSDGEPKKRAASELASLFGTPTQKQSKLNFKVLSKDEYATLEAPSDLEHRAAKMKAQAAADMGGTVMADLAAHVCGSLSDMLKAICTANAT